MKRAFFLIACFTTLACSGEVYVKCPDCEKFIEVESGLIQLEPVKCEARWRCRICWLWCWAENPPYICKACGTPMGIEN